MQSQEYASAPAILVSWVKLAFDRYKLNVYGSLHINGLSSRGVILSDSAGELISTLPSHYEETMNMVAESMALLDGLKICIRLHILTVDVDTDSESLSKVVSGSFRPPWKIDALIRPIRHFVAQGNFTLCHVLWEANSAQTS
ncbi:hypothetical protein ACH5RR_033698 [Cinchona calisaya]|uniref:RNase H type-1 domain-containing protein n=1 Tax=Cinchona calisaya TaxID=153742 RepID=A0ABD2YBP9_9GENT